VVKRHVVPDLAKVPGPRRFFQSPEMKMVDLSFAGRQGDRHIVHDAIAQAQVGAPVRLSCVGDRWQIEDVRGWVFGQMSKAFAPPIGTKFVTGKIAAIIPWRKEDADERFHHLLKRANWQVVVPELVFEEVKGAERVFRKDQNGK